MNFPDGARSEAEPVDLSRGASKMMVTLQKPTLKSVFPQTTGARL